jgi:alpha-tubulin suppressor-like RCC1 family protein
MKQRLPFLRCLMLVVSLFLLLAPARAGAQALRGTFAAGTTHSLSIHADGTLWATGDNAYGQLGLPSSTASSAGWVQVGTASDWVQVAAGYYHSLGLRADGTLWAWGDNTAGQLGSTTNNGTDIPTAPAQVAGTYTQVAAGQYHSLGLRADGSLWAWGDNTFGQLGSSIISDTNPTPMQVVGTYTQVAAGHNHSLGLRADGTLWAWGNNVFGQLATSVNQGTQRPTPTPLQVPGTYSQVAAGAYHNLGLRADGSLWAWGSNSSGQLGNSAPDAPTPTQVGTDLYTQLAAGNGYSLGMRADGSLWAWGSNRAGQLGSTSNSGTSRANPTPTQVAGTYAQVAAGHSHSLGLRADGSLLAWGFNGNGELGTSTNIGTYTPNTTPTATGTALTTRSTAAGSSFALAVRADGTLWAWGDNSYGQLGLPTTISSTQQPMQVGTDRDWLMVATGDSHTLGLKADGSVWAWGLNNYGQLGTATNFGTQVPNPTPTQVAGTYTRVAAGPDHSLALRADGSLWAWGNDYFGQLGSSNSSTTYTSTSSTPLQVPGRYTQASAGYGFSIGLRADGSLWAWGYNYFGQLGNTINNEVGLPPPNPAPVQVAGTWKQAVAGNSHTLALQADGSLWAWGNNVAGQLGTPANSATENPTPTPTQVAGTYTQATAGYLHSFARQADGTLWAWGLDSHGQLGSGTTTPFGTANYTPIREATLGTGWTLVASGPRAYFSLARTASGLTFASTGDNSTGQLGDGTTTQANRFGPLRPLAGAQPLPVQLVRFEARRSGPATVALSWATASEVNNAGFAVEKSADGRAWQRLAFVPGAGSSPTAHTYTYLDTQGTPAAYYRLAQTDFGGPVSYSPVQYVGGGSTELSLYPNPARDHATALHGAAPGSLVQVLDALGRPVCTTTADASGTAALAGLPPGLYLVRSGRRTLHLAVR